LKDSLHYFGILLRHETVYRIPSLPFWQFLSQESLTIWWLLLGLSLANHVSARVFLTSWSWQRLAKEWGIRPWAGGYTLFFLSLTASTRKKKNRLTES